MLPVVQIGPAAVQLPGLLLVQPGRQAQGVHREAVPGADQVGGDAPRCAVNTVERDGGSETRNRNGRENTEDRYHEHQFD